MAIVQGDNQEVDIKRISRDVRGFFDHFGQKVNSDTGYHIVLGLALIGFIPGLDLLIFLVTFPIALHIILRKFRLPFFLPASANLIDPNHIKSGKDIEDKNEKDIYSKAKGITYYGYQPGNKKQIYFTNDTERQHINFVATTGGGKTVGLTGFVFNTLIQGSGCIYIDGKGDPAVYLEVMAMARRVGREDDILLINYITGDIDMTVDGASTGRTNTFNPLDQGSASVISELLKSLLGESGQKNDMWKQRCESFIESLTRVFVYQRDHQDDPLTIDKYRDYIELSPIIDLLNDHSIPTSLTKSILVFLSSFLDKSTMEVLNSKDQERISELDLEEAKKQMGFITMQMTPLLNMLADDYGFIFGTQTPDIDLTDALLNRRLVFVLLPALEKSPGSLANLGKIILAAIKGMQAKSLSGQVEGDIDQLLDSRATNSPFPFKVICDECAYYLVSGSAISAAMGRSLGFSMVYAYQDYPGLERADEKEAGSIWGNTNTVVIGKLKDGDKTMQRIEQIVGEADVYIQQGLKVDKDGQVSKKYIEDGSLSIQKRKRLTIRDLSKLTEGQAYIWNSDKLLRVNLFAPFPKRMKTAETNTFVPVTYPTKDFILAMDRDYKETALKIKRMIKDKITPYVNLSTELQHLATLSEQSANLHHGFEGGLALIYGVNNLAQEENADQMRENLDDEEIADLGDIPQVDYDEDFSNGLSTSNDITKTQKKFDNTEKINENSGAKGFTSSETGNPFLSQLEEIKNIPEFDDNLDHTFEGFSEDTDLFSKHTDLDPDDLFPEEIPLDLDEEAEDDPLTLKDIAFSEINSLFSDISDNSNNEVQEFNQIEAENIEKASLHPKQPIPDIEVLKAKEAIKKLSKIII